MNRFSRIWKSMFRPTPFYVPFEYDHPATWIDVETHNGVVVGVWFRNQRLPFQQDAISKDAAHARILEWAEIDDVEIIDVVEKH